MFENCNKSKYSTGYDPKFKEPETIEILEIGENAIIEGYSKNTVAKLLCEELDMKYANAQALAAKMWKNVMATGSKRGENMLEKNLTRLEHIYHKCVDNGDYKNALSAIEQLSKLTKLYTTKVEVSTDEYIIDLIGNSGKEEN